MAPILSDIIDEDVLTAVHHSPAIGLCDESTNISVTKELILYARILCGKEVKAHFLKLSDGKAETIVKAILAYLEKSDIPLSTITGFCSDGAGSTSGVATCLKMLHPQLLPIHCINHHLALGTSQAATLPSSFWRDSDKHFQVLSLQCY